MSRYKWSILPSYSRIQKADVEYRKGFEDELLAFKERIRRRAKEKLEAAIAEAEEEERQKRLGMFVNCQLILLNFRS